eukprot:5042754-Amphidinium_carterae.1
MGNSNQSINPMQFSESTNLARYLSKIGQFVSNVRNTTWNLSDGSCYDLPSRRFRLKLAIRTLDHSGSA